MAAVRSGANSLSKMLARSRDTSRNKYRHLTFLTGQGQREKSRRVLAKLTGKCNLQWFNGDINGEVTNID